MKILRVIGRVILYLLAGIGVVTAAFVIGVVTFTLTARDAPSPPDRMVLAIDLGRGIVERDRPDVFQTLTRTGPLVLRDTLEAIRAAATDERVAGLVLDIGSAPVTLTDAQAIRRAVAAFRASGKFAHAFGESYGGLGNGTVAYYLASAAEKVWMQPSGTLGIVGVAIEAPFISGTLEKLEVETRYEQRHEYKGAGEMFVRSGFSPEARESLEGVLDSWMAQIVAGIAEARGLTPARIRGLIDEGPLLAKEAGDARLIDALAYRDEFKAMIADLAGSDAVWVTVERYTAIAPPVAGEGRKVALIFGQGPIVPGRDSGSSVGRTRGFAADTVADAILDAAKDSSVEAILLRIDSPGGAYGASDTVWRAVQVARELGKPVVASLGRTAASGGYFVAMAADRIVAEAGTVTGSIGVLTVKFVTRGLWRKLGVEWDRVQAGRRAAIGSMIGDYPPGGAERVAAFLDAVYEDFTKKVADARDFDAGQIDRVARGRIWSGAAAKKVGLIDAIGGIGVGLDALRELLELEKDAPLTIVELPRPSRIEEMLATVRRQGFDIAVLSEIWNPGRLPLLPGPITEIARQLDDIAPPVGILQMPHWRLAR